MMPIKMFIVFFIYLLQSLQDKLNNNESSNTNYRVCCGVSFSNSQLHQVTKLLKSKKNLKNTQLYIQFDGKKVYKMNKVF